METTAHHVGHESVEPEAGDYSVGRGEVAVTCGSTKSDEFDRVAI